VWIRIFFFSSAISASIPRAHSRAQIYTHYYNRNIARQTAHCQDCDGRSFVEKAIFCTKIVRFFRQISSHASAIPAFIFAPLSDIVRGKRKNITEGA
jgi:hypothetical protein